MSVPDELVKYFARRAYEHAHSEARRLYLETNGDIIAIHAVIDRDKDPRIIQAQINAVESVLSANDSRFDDGFCYIPVNPEFAHFEELKSARIRRPFDSDLIRLVFDTDLGAFHRAIDIARLLYNKGLWLADQILYVEAAYKLHHALFAFGGVCDFDLRRMLAQYAPGYTSRRALYISPYAHDLRMNFAAEQLLEDIRIARYEVEATTFA